MTRRRGGARRREPRRARLAVAVLLISACARHPTAQEELQSYLEEHRPIEPRLSRDRHHTPCILAAGEEEDALPRYSCSPPPAVGSETYLALTALAPRLRADSTPTGAHLAALWHLLWTEAPGAAGEAVARLEAASAEGLTAPLAIDLSAALFVQAAEEDDASLLGHALEILDRTLEGHPENRRLLFNRALVLERLQLEAEARRAWLAYLEVEPDEQWREEAVFRLERLQPVDGARLDERFGHELEAAALAADREALARLARTSPQRSREWGEAALREWSRLYLETDLESAGQRLLVARRVGEALAVASGERFLVDASLHLHDVVQKSPESALLIAGALDRARRNLQPKSNEIDLLLQARSELERASSPLQEQLRLQLGLAYFERARYDEALAELARRSEGWSVRGHHRLAQRATWLEGSIALQRGRPALALERYQQALETALRLGEEEDAAHLLGLLGEAYSSLGKSRRAWLYYLQGLAKAHRLGSRTTLSRAANWTADFTLRSRRPALSLYYQQVAVEAAREADPLELADVLLWRGLLHSLLDHPTPAEQDLDGALAQLDLLEADRARQVEADIRLVRGRVLTRKDPAAALRDLDRAVEHYEAGGHLDYAILAHEARAEALQRAGSVAQAEEELQKSIELREQFGRGLPDDTFRLALSRHSASAYDRLTAFLLEERQDPAAALLVAERERLAGLDGGASGLRDGGVPSLDELQRGLPEGAVVVAMEQLSDRLVIWLLDRHRLSSQSVGLGELEARELLADALRRRPAHRPWRDRATALHERLIAPWIDQIPAAATLVLLPDKALHSLPFAALVDPRSDRFLVEERPLLVALSTTSFVSGSSARRTGPGSLEAPPDRILVVAATAFDRRLNSELPPLPGAEREGAAIAALYGDDATLLSGEQASRQALLTELPHHRLLHFAGHAVVDPQQPSRSRLLLAPANGHEALEAGDIFDLDLRHTRLVVLSACDTAVGTVESGENAMSLARPFLVAGASAVIASLWKVDDEVAAALFVRFHESLLGGETPAEALRQAQLAAIRAGERDRPDPPDWSAFVLIGGGGN